MGEKRKATGAAISIRSLDAAAARHSRITDQPERSQPRPRICRASRAKRPREEACSRARSGRRWTGSHDLSPRRRRVR